MPNAYGTLNRLETYKKRKVIQRLYEEGKVDEEGFIDLLLKELLCLDQDAAIKWGTINCEKFHLAIKERKRILKGGVIDRSLTVTNNKKLPYYEEVISRIPAKRTNFNDPSIAGLISPEGISPLPKEKPFDPTLRDVPFEETLGIPLGSLDGMDLSKITPDEMEMLVREIKNVEFLKNITIPDNPNFTGKDPDGYIPPVKQVRLNDLPPKERNEAYRNMMLITGRKVLLPNETPEDKAEIKRYSLEMGLINEEEEGSISDEIRLDNEVKEDNKES
jgi:hypothetical protein